MIIEWEKDLNKGVEIKTFKTRDHQNSIKDLESIRKNESNDILLCKTSKNSKR